MEYYAKSKSDMLPEQEGERKTLIMWLQIRVEKNVREHMEYELREDDVAKEAVRNQEREDGPFRKFGGVVDRFMGRIAGRWRG